jgi:hypothetical protein
MAVSCSLVFGKSRVAKHASPNPRRSPERVRGVARRRREGPQRAAGRRRPHAPIAR